MTQTPPPSVRTIFMDNPLIEEMCFRKIHTNFCFSKIWAVIGLLAWKSFFFVFHIYINFLFVKPTTDFPLIPRDIV